MRQAKSWIATPLAALVALCAGNAGAASFVFDDFSNVLGMTLNGSASAGGGVLRLTPALGNRRGSAFFASAITLGSADSFSTFFTFRIGSSGGTPDSDGLGGDGITFIVQANAAIALGGVGGGIGYQGVPNSAAVEYDTHDDGVGNGDPNGSHIGIDLGGSVDSSATATLVRLNDGGMWFTWIDYDGVTDLMEVRLSTSSARPTSALLSYTFDLGAQLGSTSAYVGFGSATGVGFGSHEISRWEFASIPEPGTLWLLGLGSLALASLRRRRA